MNKKKILPLVAGCAALGGLLIAKVNNVDARSNLLMMITSVLSSNNSSTIGKKPTPKGPVLVNPYKGIKYLAP